MRVLRSTLTLLLLPCLLAVAAVADDQHKHKESGDPSQLGSVNFPTSCSAAANKSFERALAMLHSFWYEEAEAAFNAAAAADPSCSIAQWGVAMSLFHPLWYPADAATMKKGLDAVEKGKATPAKTERERDYLAAIETYYKDYDQSDHASRRRAYAAAMEQLASKYKDDPEATIFYALALLGAADPKDKSLANQKKAGALLEPIYQQQPNHPGVAHYIIHAYDDPALAQGAVEAARRYSQIAPEAPHALHMPSHIFTRLGLWQDSINSNLASAAAAHAHFAKSQMKGALAQELHAMDYAVYAYLQTGQEGEALKLRDAALKITAAAPADNTAHYEASAIPARCALELGHWKEAVALTPVPNASPAMQAITWFAVGVGAGHLADRDRAKMAHDKLEQIRETLLASKDEQARVYWSEQVEIQRREVAAWVAFAEDRNDDAVLLMRSAVDLEESTEKHPVTPGQVVPARELLGDLYMALRQPSLALHEYEKVLVSTPNRFNAVYNAARAAKLLEEQDKARQYYAKLVEISHPKSQRSEVELAREATGVLKKAGKR